MGGPGISTWRADGAILRCDHRVLKRVARQWLLCADEILHFAHSVTEPMKKGTSLYLDLVRFSAALMVFLEHLREHTKNSFDAFWKSHPFWSMSFEVAYYVGIALLVFAKGRTGLMSVALISVVAGPTMVLLAPTWFLGYGAYHLSQRPTLRPRFATVLWLGSTVLLLLCP